MARLKKTITKEVTGTKKSSPPQQSVPQRDGENSNNPNTGEAERPRAMTMM